MACAIPDFNFQFKVTYDISTSTPTVTITNQSTGGSGLIDYFFIAYTPSGLAYHTGSWISPDVFSSGTLTFAQNIPQSNGHVEFSNLPYKITGYAKDSLGNICDLDKLDIICAPTGNSGKNNFGAIYLDIQQKCTIGRLQIIDKSNYLYQGVTGVNNGSPYSVTTLVYPTTEGTVSTANAVVNNQTSFTLPIPINSVGHELYRKQFLKYTLPSGDEVIVKYYYEKKDLAIDCNISLCSIFCGLTKYRLAFEGENGVCSDEDMKKYMVMTMKIAELTLGLNNLNCGIDVYTLNAEIKEELLLNDCYCDCNDNTGNNEVTALACAGIDIPCVWTALNTLLQSGTPNTQLCTLVNNCVTAANINACAQVYIAGVLFTTSKITINFQLANTTNSTGVKIYYKLHSSGTWIQFGALLPANSTTVDITGSFTAGDTYDVKIKNECTLSQVDSSIITGIIVGNLDSCYLLDKIYTTLPTGLYVVEVNTALTGCAKIVPKLIDSAALAPYIPCPFPENLKISEAKLVTWTGATGTYEVAYKLKASGTWLIFANSATSFTASGTTCTADMSAVTMTPLADYEFRVTKYCTPSLFSLPAYCDFKSSFVQCKSAGSFIDFNQTTGVLRWNADGDLAATYVFSASLGLSALAAPTGSPVISAITASSSSISVDYSNIVSILAANVGAKIYFNVYRDCGSGSKSDTQTYAYTIQPTLTACPTFIPGFGFNTIVDNVIIINPSGGTVPNASITQTQFQCRVNGAFAGTGLLVLDGGVETKFKSTIHIVNGDLVEFRFKSYCACCSNSTSVTSWSSWFGTNASNIGWDDIWKTLSSGFFTNGVTGVGAEYKINRDGKLRLRGLANFSAVTPPPSGMAGWGFPTGSNDLSNNFLDISSLSSSLNPSINLAATTDYFPTNAKQMVISSTVYCLGGTIKRTGSILNARIGTINTSGSNNTSAIELDLNSVIIE